MLPETDLSTRMSFQDLTGLHLVVEEKLDGSQCTVGFNATGRLLLHSCCAFLTAADDALLPDSRLWAERQADALIDLLEDRYVMYGGWMDCKHTVYYDQLPHYFMEFAVFDQQISQMSSFNSCCSSSSCCWGKATSLT